MLGTDFPYLDFIPKQPKIVQIDSDPAHLGRRAPLELGLCGHVADTLTRCFHASKSRGHDRLFLDDVLTAHATAMEHKKTYVEKGGSDGKIRPEQVGDAVNRLCSPDSIIIADTGHVRACLGRRRFLQAASRAKGNDFVQSRHDGQRHARLLSARKWHFRSDRSSPSVAMAVSPC